MIKTIQPDVTPVSGDNVTHGRPDITGARKLVLDRAKEFGVSLADLSRAANRNVTYIHQFVHKGTPKHLPEETRRAVAAMLHLDENLLRSGAPKQTQSPPRMAPPHVLAGAEVGWTTQVPLFLEHQDIVPTQALLTTMSISSKIGPADFAI